MSLKIASLGELVVEFFRPEVDTPFNQTGVFLGPYASGAPAIFLDAIARLGFQCWYFATVGPDPFGDFLLERLAGDGIDVRGVHRVEETTGVAFSSFSSDGSRKYIYHLGNAAPGQFGPQHLNQKVLSQVDFLHISANVMAFSDSAHEACMQAFDLVQRSGGRISFDPNIRPEVMSREDIWRLCGPVIRCASVVLPSGDEARMLTGASTNDAACRDLVAMGVPVVALKEDRHGSRVFTEQGTWYVPAFEVVEIDPTGAGDSYDAGFIYGLLKDWDWEGCARFANALGALTVKARGPMEGFRNLGDVEKFIRTTAGAR